VVDGEFVVEAELELDEDNELLADSVRDSAGLFVCRLVPVYDVDGLALSVGFVIVGFAVDDTVPYIDFDSVFVFTTNVAVSVWV